MASDSITLLVGFISFLTGILASFGLYFLQQRRRKLNLRRALFIEVQVPATAIEGLPEIPTEMDVDEVIETSTQSNSSQPLRTKIPTAVYEAHINDIGLLSRPELEAVVEYYATATIAKEQLENITDADAKKRFLTETAPPLKETRKTAEEKLGEESPFSSLYNRFTTFLLVVVVAVIVIGILSVLPR
jgi:hypothetical protein